MEPPIPRGCPNPSERQAAVSADKVIAEIRAAPSWRRLELNAKLEKDFGRGFVKTLKEQLAAEERENEAESRKRPHRCKQAPGSAASIFPAACVK